MAKDNGILSNTTSHGDPQTAGRHRGLTIEQGHHLAMTNFIGRRQWMSTARRLLSETRMLTLTGPAGVGKTRLALRLGAELRRAFPAGVFFVELDKTDHSGVDGAIRSVLGRGAEDGEPPPAALANRLHEQQSLLILDTCDQVLDAVAPAAMALLSAVSGLRIIATSRQSLGIAGETTLPVPPMSVPAPGTITREMLVQFDALAFFIDRAMAYQPDFDIDACEPEHIVELCRDLDGLPLALDLAASRLPVLTVRQISRRLDRRFDLLTLAGQHFPDRHRTLRAAVQWSYEQCTPAEQLLWARLSVFGAGFELEAVEQVCSGGQIDREEVFDLIAALVGKSVLIREAPQGMARYRLLNTLRQYGRERLAETGEQASLEARHRDWCLDLAKGITTGWLSHDQNDWYIRIAAESRSIIDALEFCLADAEADPSATVELAAAYWGQRLYHVDLRTGRDFLDRAMSRPGVSETARAHGHRTCAMLALMSGDAHTAHHHLDDCALLVARLRDPVEDARLHHALGTTHMFNGEYRRASSLLREALAAQRSLGLDQEAHLTACQLSECDVMAGYPMAEEYSAQSMAQWPPSAYWFRSQAVHVTALAHMQGGRLEEASLMMREAIRIKWTHHDLWGVAMGLEALFWIEARRRPDTKAARLLALAERAWRNVGTDVVGLPHIAAHRDAAAAAIEANLGHDEFVDNSDPARVRLLDAGVAVILEQGGTQTRRLANTDKLTPRETEVAELVAAGLTNKEIASRLVIAQRTAETHVEHILAKLGFTSRSQIATWMSEYRRSQDRGTETGAARGWAGLPSGADERRPRPAGKGR